MGIAQICLRVVHKKSTWLHTIIVCFGSDKITDKSVHQKEKIYVKELLTIVLLSKFEPFLDLNKAAILDGVQNNHTVYILEWRPTQDYSYCVV